MLNESAPRSPRAFLVIHIMALAFSVLGLVVSANTWIRYGAKGWHAGVRFGRFEIVHPRPFWLSEQGWQFDRLGLDFRGLPLIGGNTAVGHRTFAMWPLPAVLCFTLMLHIKRRASRRTWGCHVCHYDLTGNTSGTCPECGNRILPVPSSEDKGGG